MKKSSTVLVLILILISCGNKSNISYHLLKQDTMQAILWDVIRADAFTTEYAKPDSSKNASEENVKLQKAIFAKHRISREDFYNSFNYYKMNSGLMKVILDSIINKANRERVNNILIKPLTGSEK